MPAQLIKNARIVSDSKVFSGDLLIENGLIARVDRSISDSQGVSVIEADGNYLLPGIIDDQVHFREPGFTHKGDIYTESRAALAGGVTSFMEMPNVFPQTVTNAILEEKYKLGSVKSAVNYSFYLGATNNNAEEIKSVNPRTVCGVKIFMGSSTGDMLVDNQKALASIFDVSPILIATHCESEERVKQRFDAAFELFSGQIPANQHPIIRDAQACIMSSSSAIELAKKYDSRLHILHISSEIETHLFRNDIPLKDKRITAEVCVHYLHFTDNDYARLGNLIKCNPAIKTLEDQKGLWKALLDNRLDIIATDHAPHTLVEKQKLYTQSPSGLPLVQHSLSLMMDYVVSGAMQIETLVEKMCHNPAICFQVEKRGFIREGFAADLVLLGKNSTAVSRDTLLQKCAWSPFENHIFAYTPQKVWVNGILGWNGVLTGQYNPQRLVFDRKN